MLGASTVARWLKTLLAMLAFRMGTTPSAGCSAPHPAFCILPGKAAEHGPRLASLLPPCRPAGSAWLVALAWSALAVASLSLFPPTPTVSLPFKQRNTFVRSLNSRLVPVISAADNGTLRLKTQLGLAEAAGQQALQDRVRNPPHAAPPVRQRLSSDTASRPTPPLVRHCLSSDTASQVGWFFTGVSAETRIPLGEWSDTNASF